MDPENQGLYLEPGTAQAHTFLPVDHVVWFFCMIVVEVVVVAAVAVAEKAGILKLNLI